MCMKEAAVAFCMPGVHGKHATCQQSVHCCCLGGHNILVRHSVTMQSNFPYAKLNVSNLSQGRMPTSNWG